jgi:Protein of unknown function (DUF3710)
MAAPWQPVLAAELVGPHDADEVEPRLLDSPGLADFGGVRVPVPRRGSVTVDPAENGRMQAVHVALPEGRLSVSALAAPKSSRLWPELAKEIDASLRDGGARVRSFQGEWGRELHATSGAATSVFVGVDGARWMLYGVATGPTRDAARLLDDLRRMVRGTIVVRGAAPYPVRTVLPLEMPPHLAPDAGAAAGAPEAGTVVVRAVVPADRTVAIPVTGRHPAPRAEPGPLWPDPVQRIADGAPPAPLDAGRDPEDPPTEVWAQPPLPAPVRNGHAGRPAPARVPSPPRAVSLRPLAPPAAPPGAVRRDGRHLVGLPSPGPGDHGPAVLRRGRHAAPESGTPAADPVTEPLARIRSAAVQPSGRHRRRG